MAKRGEFKKQTKLAEKAYKAFKALDDKSYKQRIQTLVSVHEYGFAILILWSRIEITLKLLRYYDKKEEYPDKLDFISRKWKILNNVYMSNSNFYDLIIQNQSKSLWKTRDRIAHAAINISKEDYDKYKPAADYFLLSISQSLQPINEYKAKLKRKRVK